MRVSRDALALPWTLDDDARTVLAAMSEARARQRQEAGRRVFRLRKAKGWNHEDLAHHSHLSVSTISRIERGKHDAYGSTIKQIAEALGVEPDALHPPLLDADAGQSITDQLDRIERKVDVILSALRELDEEGLERDADDLDRLDERDDDRTDEGQAGSGRAG